MSIEMVPVEIWSLQGGAFADKINESIQAVMADVQARDHIKSPRMITAKIKVSPGREETDGEFLIEISCTVNNTVPATKYGVERAMQRDGQFMVSGPAPEQTDIEEAITNIEELKTAP